MKPQTFELIRKAIMNNLECPGNHFMTDLITVVEQTGDFNGQEVREVVWSMLHKGKINADGQWRITRGGEG